MFNFGCRVKKSFAIAAQSALGCEPHNMVEENPDKGISFKDDAGSADSFCGFIHMLKNASRCSCCLDDFGMSRGEARLQQIGKSLRRADQCQSEQIILHL